MAQDATYTFSRFVGDPDGDSYDDLIVEREAGKLLGIELVDHVVVGEEGYTSFRESRLLRR